MYYDDYMLTLITNADLRAQYMQCEWCFFLLPDLNLILILILFVL